MAKKQITYCSETQELTVSQIKQALKELKKANKSFKKCKKYIVVPQE